MLFGRGPMMIEDDDNPKKTKFPIPFEGLQSILNQLGYGMCFHNPETKRIHFSLETPGSVSPRANKILGGPPKNAPSHVTICMPDFVHDDYQTPVYDVDYVVDLLNKINGQVGGDTGTKLIALLIEQREKH